MLKNIQKNIFAKWLSAYNIQYPRSIVYMLQASEYKLEGYFKWLKNIKSFKKVEVRKKFVPTKKALLLLVVAWVFVVTILALAVFFLDSGQYVLMALVVVLLPFVLACGIAVPVFLIKVLIQKPIEYWVISSAKSKLRKHKAFKIAVAGSYGKTTMREILKMVLMEGKKVAAPPENHNTMLGMSSFIKSLKGDEEVLIFEFGEYYKGDIKEMCEFVQPDLGVITGVNEAHLEKFKSLEITASTIFELSDYLGNKPVYVNGENTLTKGHSFKNHLVYSRNGINEWKVEKPRSDLTGTYFSLVKDNNKFKLTSKLLGLHQVGPLFASIHIALLLGIPMEKIQKGVSNTKPFVHRLEPRTDPSGVTIIDDSYNGNPDGARAVIEFLVSLKGHRRFYVTPGLVEMGHRTVEVHREIGKQLAKSGIEKVVLIKNSVTGYIEQGLKEGSYKGEILWFETGLKAFAALPHLTVKGDVVLLQNDWPDQYY